MTPKQHCEKLIAEASKNSDLKGYFKEESVGEDVCMLPHANYFGGGYLAAVYSYYYETYEKIELTSLTKATLPTNRNRTTIGVGEEVTITSNTPVFWEIDSNFLKADNIQKSQPSTKLTITTLDRAGSISIKAKHQYDEKTITFTIITPRDLFFDDALDLHIQDVLDSGFIANTYLQPNTVNFYALEVRELESFARGTGILSDAKGKPHGHYTNGGSEWISAEKYTEGKGNFIGIDTVYGGRDDYPIPLPLPEGGQIVFFINYQWRLKQTQKFHKIPKTVIQTTTIQTNGYVTTRKQGVNGASATFHYKDPSENKTSIPNHTNIKPNPMSKEEWAKKRASWK